MEQTQHDFDTPIEKTSTELARMIIDKLNFDKEFLVIESYEKASPIKKAAFIEKSTDFSIEVLKEIGKSDIPFPYATRSIDKIQLVLESLKRYIEGTITQSRHEYASRSLGIKSPDSQKYTEECVTVGQLMLKLDEVRQSQGNVRNDYFNDVTPTEEGLSTGKTVEDVVAGKSVE